MVIYSNGKGVQVILEADNKGVEETKQILVAIAKLEENMRNMSAKIDDIGKMSSVVLETEQRAKSAHNRIDDLKQDLIDRMKEQQSDIDDLKNTLKKVWFTLFGGAVTFVFGVALYFISKI